MSPQRSKKDTVEVVFSRAAGYKVIAATGAWGGVSANREVVFDLYVERRADPERMEIDVVGEKQVDERRFPSPQPFHREAQVGVVLRPDIARAVGQFLIGLADKASPPEKPRKR